MYAPYLLQHHPHIPSLNYIHIPPGGLHLYMSPHLFLIEAHDHSPKSTIEQRSNRRIWRSNEQRLKIAKDMSGKEGENKDLVEVYVDVSQEEQGHHE